IGCSSFAFSHPGLRHGIWTTPDQHTLTREEATRALENASRENFSMYLMMLSQQLTNETSESIVRSAAGIALKNTMKAKEVERREEMINKWINLDASVKSQIKMGALMALGAKESMVGTTAAQVVEAIANIELPRNEWSELVPTLVNYMSSPESDVNRKKATMEAIGFICEQFDSDAIKVYSNNLMTAIFQGARVEEPSSVIRKASLNALYNSLEFAEENFNHQGERDYIMKVVFEAAQSNDGEICVSAFECLVKIMQLYYEHMSGYMQAGLYKASINAMKSNNVSLALQAIEFWTTVCEVEIDLSERSFEIENFARIGSREIVPVLLILLTQQEEDADEDEWNVAMSAATCLGFLAHCVGKDLLEDNTILNFIQTYITSPDWHQKEAAVMALGTMAEGNIESPLFTDFLRNALPVLLDLMNDPSADVRDSVAWTVGEIMKNYVAFFDTAKVQSVIKCLIDHLNDKRRIATNCAFAIANLCSEYSETAETDQTNDLSPFFNPFVQIFLNLVQKQEQNDSNFKLSLHYALSCFVSASANDCSEGLVSLTNLMLEHLNFTLQHQNVSVDDSLSEVQSNILSVIDALVKRLGKKMVPVADQLMTLLLNILSCSKNTTVADDILNVIKEICGVVEGSFNRYMVALNPILLNVMGSHDDQQ
ncbi:ARM repeat-containing protein, partial [Rozella allomycis CSF55]